MSIAFLSYLASHHTKVEYCNRKTSVNIRLLKCNIQGHLSELLQDEAE